MYPLEVAISPDLETSADRTVMWARPRPVAPARRDRSTCVLRTIGPPVPAGLRGPVVDGRYRLVAPLKRGGMGELYAAEHLGTGRRVAVKLLRAPWCHDIVARQRLRREAQAGARVDHPHVVDTLDFGVTPEGLCYLVMELLYGEDLYTTLQRERRMPVARATGMMRQICAALAAAHAAGIVHRDLKPANCFRVGFRGVEDFLKIVDFGLAHDTVSKEAGEGPLTAAGTVLGTSYYMPPEQVTGGPVDHRVDIHACGVLFYQMVTGRPPFRGPTAAETFRQILTDDPPSARDACPELSPAFDLLIRTALAKRRESRFQSVDEFAVAVAALPDLRRGSARPINRGLRCWAGVCRTAVLPATAVLAAMAAVR